MRDFHHYFHIGGVKVHRKHVKFFLLYGGMIGMSLDWGFSLLGPMIFHAVAEHYEPIFAEAGKTGAAMAGFPCFCEKILSAEA